MTTIEPSAVLETSAAPSDAAVAHFAALLAFETDCADVNTALQAAEDHGTDADFVLLDVRSPAAYAAGHVAGAVNLPTRSIDADALTARGDGPFVVYCAGPHCNGADKAALRIARLGRPVKKMIGGVTGWLDEGFALTATPKPTEQP